MGQFFIVLQYAAFNIFSSSFQCSLECGVMDQIRCCVHPLRFSEA